MLKIMFFVVTMLNFIIYQFCKCYLNYEKMIESNDNFSKKLERKVMLKIYQFCKCYLVILYIISLMKK